ncbi:MAG: FAD-binding oxidoreductase [Acidobacteria bacterium]|nr:FAD-binding oxidoreductase [Acidobacteriota bacterium]
MSIGPAAVASPGAKRNARKLRLANVFHAGDGNLHPFICFDSRSPDEVQRVKEAGRELMETCVSAGGTITGEHGVGLDKRDFLPLIFSHDDMDTMLRVRAAFDPTRLCNPGKIIPMLRGCGEARVLSEPRAIATGSPRGSGLSLQQRGAASLKNLEVDTPERRSHSGLKGGKATGPGRAYFDPDDAAKQLSAIVGVAHVTESPRLPTPVSTGNPVHPSSVVATPGSIEEVCELMKLASSEGWSVVPSGASTWLYAGNPIQRVNVVIGTARLNKFLDHEPADLVASAQSGVTLETFNQTLAAGGQWLPLDPPDDGRATIGGVVATGLGGAQKCGYGLPRNFVIGMRVVLPDGKLVKAGGRVVKNVAGYDLCKLFTASYGTLGLIAELTFKLRPRPSKEVTVLAEGSLERVLKAAQSIHQARLFPVGNELVSSALAQRIGVEIATGNVLLLTRFAGMEKTVSYQIEKAVAEIRGEAGIADIEIESDDQFLWRNLAAAPMKLDQMLTWRATVPATQVGKFIEIVMDTYLDSFCSSLWHAGIADGRVRVIGPLHADASPSVCT